MKSLLLSSIIIVVHLRLTYSNLTLIDHIKKYNVENSEEILKVLQTNEPCFNVEDLNMLVTDMKEVTDFRFTSDQPKIDLEPPNPAPITNATACSQATINVWKQFYRLSRSHLLAMQNLGAQFSEEEISQLHQIRKMNVIRDAVSLCVSLIVQGDVQTAKEKFLAMDDQDQLYAIVFRTYEFGKVNNILEFIETLPQADQRVMGYEAMLKEFEDHNDLKNPHLLTLQYYLQKTKGGGTIIESKQAMSSLENKLERIIPGTVEEMASSIMSNNFSSLIELSDDQFTGNVFRKYIERILKIAVSHLKKESLHCLDLAQALNNKQNSAIVYINIYTLIKAAGYYDFKVILRLAFCISTLLHVPSNQHHQLHQVLSDMPIVVQSIVLGDICLDLSNRSKIKRFLCINEEKIVTLCESCVGNVWRFKPQYDGTVFSIMSSNTGLYLSATAVDFTVASLKINRETDIKNTELWQLEKVDERSGVFKILNYHYEHYLNTVVLVHNNKEAIGLTRSNITQPNWIINTG